MVAPLACPKIFLSHLVSSQAQGFPPKRVWWFTGLGTPGPPSLSVFNLIRSGFASDKQLVLCNGASSTAENHLEVAEFGAVFSLFQQMGLNEEEAKMVLNKNPDAISSSFDSIQGRIRSLQLLGLSSFQIARLISKRPDLLTAGDASSLIHFFHDYLGNKLKPSHVVRLLVEPEPGFSKDFMEKVELLVKLGIPQEEIVNVLNKVNLKKAICHKSVEQIEMIITLLNRYGGGAEILVRRPIILNYDLDTQLIPRIGFLKGLSGGDEEATSAVIKKLPAVLSYSEEHMEAQVEFMKSFAGLSYEEIFRVILIFPNLISSSRERKLEPRISFLKDCGFDSSDIYRFLTKSPLFLGLSFEGNLAHKLSMLVKIGYAYRTKALSIALGAVTRTSVENLQKVIGLYLSYGLSTEDIVTMSEKQPQILQYNPKSLEEKMEYLVDEMGRDVGELLSFPAYLGYNLDKRIKHRYEEKRKNVGGGEGMSINKLLSVSVERFSKTKKKYMPDIVHSDNEILEEVE